MRTLTKSDDPRQLYEDAKVALLRHCALRDDVLTFFQYGHISEPGVSDLDLIAVVEDEPLNGIAKFLEKEALPPIVQAAMAHGNMIVVPRGAIYGLVYWDDIALQDLSQPDIPVELPVDINTKHRSYAMLIDWSYERIYRMKLYARIRFDDQRKILGDMKSFMYSVANFQSLFPSVEVPRAHTLQQGLRQLRSQWVNLDSKERNKRLNGLVREFSTLALAFEELLFVVLEANDLYPTWDLSEQEHELVFPHGMRFRFVKEFCKQDSLRVQVPRRILHHFRCYCCHNAGLSNTISDAFCPSVPDTDEANHDVDGYLLFLKQRFKYCNYWYKYLKTHGFTYGLYKYGWFLKGP